MKTRLHSDRSTDITTDYLLDLNSDLPSVLASYNSNQQSSYLYGMGLIGQYETRQWPNNITSTRWMAWAYRIPMSCFSEHSTVIFSPLT